MTTNIATLAVLAATMLWSAGQRPTAADTVAQASAVPVQRASTNHSPEAAPDTAVAWHNPSTTPVGTAKQVSLKPVGYLPALSGN